MGANLPVKRILDDFEGAQQADFALHGWYLRQRYWRESGVFHGGVVRVLLECFAKFTITKRSNATSELAIFEQGNEKWKFQLV